jgi:hypothetical protein
MAIIRPRNEQSELGVMQLPAEYVLLTPSRALYYFTFTMPICVSEVLHPRGCVS